MLRILTALTAAASIALGATAALAQSPQTDGWVVLSLDEYRTLRARAFPTPPATTVSGS